MATVSLKNVSFHGAGEAALRNFSLEIPDRAFAVLTGPRGSGASAILRLIAGLEEADAGEIFVGEKNVSELKPSAREVAVVFSEPALYPQMSVRENLAFGLKQRKFSTTETARRVEDAAAALAITELLEKRPAELSLEQRQRVSIARAIARQPKVILFDEPLAKFDPATRTKLRAELRQLHERLEATFVYSTIHPSEAMTLGERVVVLQNGEVGQNDFTATVYDQPANLFVAEFFGEPPMNFIHGTLKLERDALLFRESGEGTTEVRMPRAEDAGLDEWSGRSVMLGIRPEHLEVVPSVKGQEPANSFPVLVDFVESAGAETTLRLQTGAHTLVARRFGTSGEEPVGRRVRCLFDPEQARFFDPASSRRIAGL